VKTRNITLLRHVDVRGGLKQHYITTPNHVEMVSMGPNKACVSMVLSFRKLGIGWAIPDQVPTLSLSALLCIPRYVTLVSEASKVRMAIVAGGKGRSSTVIYSDLQYGRRLPIPLSSDLQYQVVRTLLA